MTTESQKAEENLTQATYTETPYRDSSWEVVGEFGDNTNFEPLAFEVTNSWAGYSDPMFADYGGVPAQQQQRRFHAPQGAQAEAAAWSQPQPGNAEVVDESHIRQQIEAEAAAKIQDALEQGRREGEEAAVAASEQKMQELREHFEGVILDFATQLAEHRRIVEKQALELSLQVAEKLVGTAVDINPEYVIKVIKEALDLSGGAVIKCVRVSPEDHEFLKLINLSRHFKESEKSWEFISDETVRAGCVVETSAGDIDYRFDRSFDRIRDQVMKLV